MTQFLITFREVVAGEWETLLEAETFVLDGDWFLFHGLDANVAWVQAYDVKSIVRQESASEELND